MAESFFFITKELAEEYLNTKDTVRRAKVVMEELTLQKINYIRTPRALRRKYNKEIF